MNKKLKVRGITRSRSEVILYLPKKIIRDIPHFFEIELMINNIKERKKDYGRRNKEL